MLPSGLSMLWESTESSTALRDRFGFTSFDAAVAWVCAGLASSWGIMVRSCDRLVISDRNVILWADTELGDVVVKWSADEPLFDQLDRSSRLMHDLSGSGVPVPGPLLTTTGNVRTILHGPAGRLSVTVLPELAGGWLDIGDPVAVRAAGACLARLHQALAAIGDQGWPPADPRPFPVRIRKWLDERDRGRAPEASVRLRELMTRAPEVDDRYQLVHNDFRAANILTNQSDIVGVLDFDNVLLDHPVTDLARASIYLGTRFTSWAPTPLTAREQLRAGYESIRPLLPTESVWLEILTLWHGIAAVPDDDTAGWAAAL